MKELDQGWRLDPLPSAQGELSGALGQPLGSRDGRGGEGLKPLPCLAPDVQGGLLGMLVVVR